MRVCLDELYSPKIAAALRTRGHDAISLHDRPGLIALPDAELFDRMAAEHRAIVTENAIDYVPLARALAVEGRSHFGLVLTSSASLRRSRNTIGRFVRALDTFLGERPADDAMRDQVAWLRQAD
jgi:predicted nuclease of predicted toxin-antitoxin system